MHTLLYVSGVDAESRPRRGRPEVETDPDAREKHIACACARIMKGESVEKVAKRFDISVRTVQLWTRRALRYDHPVSRVLKTLVA